MPKELVLLTFTSTHYALKAEKTIQGAGLNGRLIPMPRDLSALCGLALELEPATSGHALALLQVAGVKVEKRIRVSKEGGLIRVKEEMEGDGQGAIEQSSH